MTQSDLLQSAALNDNTDQNSDDGLCDGHSTSAASTYSTYGNDERGADYERRDKFFKHSYTSLVT